jgi:hypothetical protein
MSTRGVQPGQSEILLQALQEIRDNDAISADTANRLYSISAPTTAIRDYVKWALDDHGALLYEDNLSIAGLMQPIHLPTNPKLEGVLNELREQGSVSEEDGQRLFEAMGKISKQEQAVFLQFMRVLYKTPNFTEDDFNRLMNQHDQLIGERSQHDIPHHRALQKKQWAAMAMAIGSFSGMMLVPGLRDTLQAVTPVDALAHVVQVALAFGAAYGSNVLAKLGLKPERNAQAIADYGTND